MTNDQTTITEFINASLSACSEVSITFKRDGRPKPPVAVVHHAIHRKTNGKHRVHWRTQRRLDAMKRQQASEPVAA